MGNKWRPAGFDSVVDTILLQHKGHFMSPKTLINKGADEMLAAVRKQLSIKVPWVIDDKTTLCPDSYGWLHFIPDGLQPVSNPNKSYTCSICYKPFYDIEELVDHLKQHHVQKWCPAHGYPLPCAKCGLKDYVGEPVLDKPEAQWLDLTLADFYRKLKGGSRWVFTDGSESK